MWGGGIVLSSKRSGAYSISLRLRILQEGALQVRLEVAILVALASALSALHPGTSQRLLSVCPEACQLHT